MGRDEMLIRQDECFAFARLDAKAVSVGLASPAGGNCGSRVGGFLTRLLKAHGMMLGLRVLVVPRRLAVNARQIARARARPQRAPWSKMCRRASRRLRGGLRSIASGRSPLRATFVRSCTLSGVKMRTLFRPREMLTYHCCAFVAARMAESAKST